MEVFAWGSGSYGRLGLGGSQDKAQPCRVGGALNGHRMRLCAAGWYVCVCVCVRNDAFSISLRCEIRGFEMPVCVCVTNPSTHCAHLCF